MPDSKRGRDKKAHDAENRQRGWEGTQDRERFDEVEPRDEQGKTNEIQREENKDPDSPLECHRRDCVEPAAFLVFERYQEETGHGAVEARASLCRKHTTEESPTHLDDVYADYIFRIEPLPKTTRTDTK